MRRRQTAIGRVRFIEKAVAKLGPPNQHFRGRDVDEGDAPGAGEVQEA